MSEEYFKIPNKPKPIPKEERKLRMTIVAKITNSIKDLTASELMDVYGYMVSLSKKANTNNGGGGGS